ncbi:MAG: PAS domain S-box protein, partial [Clostridia bacterium]|nr:PAS domain S-box protein [Clostridia bacterium]
MNKITKRSASILIMISILLSWYIPVLANPIEPDVDFYETIIRQHGAIMLLIDPENGEIVFANHAAATFYGYSVDTLQTMRMNQINTLTPQAIEREMQLAASEQRNYFLFKHRLADGQVRDVETYSYPVVVAGRTLLFSVISDVTEKLMIEEHFHMDMLRWIMFIAALAIVFLAGMILLFNSNRQIKKRERAFRESEERFRLLVETAPDAIFLVSGRTVAYANQAAVQLLKAESVNQLIGHPVMTWLHPSFKEAVEKRYQILLAGRQRVPPMEQIYVCLDGSELPVEVTAAPIQYHDSNGALIYVRDISERKNREEKRISDLLQFRQQQKLESIGTLASGVAHEINNPIMGIINYSQLIIDENANDSINWYAQEIMTEGNRISRITSDLLFYSRQQKQTHSPADIRDIIQRTLSLIGGVLKKDQIEIEILPAPELPLIKCRSQQIQQILMNLLTNARDTLNEKYPGSHPDKVIILSMELYEDAGRRWIRITVEDHGKGIPKSYRDKLFDPFFTTKPRDVSTGLGLPISYGIARDHHGRLEYDTVEGQYTQFHLHLPVDNGWDIE